MKSYIVMGSPIALSQTWVQISIITISGSTVRTVELTSGTSPSLIHVPMAKWNTPTGWYSMLSKSDCMMLQTPRAASGSRNYPMHSGGYVLSLLLPQGSHPISWSTALKPSCLLMSCGDLRRLTSMKKA
jgi:hypothetical protein